VAHQWPFLIERAALRAGDEVNTSIVVVGVDPSGDGFLAHYFDSEGVNDSYRIKVREGAQHPPA
jgi:hypothetical protein